MSCPAYIKRRLLLSVIRAPTLSSSLSPGRWSTQIRTLHQGDLLRSQEFSVTFGPQIDGLLKPERRKAKNGSLGKGRSKTKKEEKGLAEDSAITATSNPAKRKRPAGSSRHEALIQIQTGDGSVAPKQDSDPNPSIIPTPEKGLSDHDETTLELSGDAYNTISEPERTYSNPRKLDFLEDIAQQRGKPARVRRRSPSDDRPDREPKPTTTPPINRKTSPVPPRQRSEQWQIQKDALLRKFGDDGWSPRKKLSPDAMEGIRSLHEQDPERYTTPILSQQFKVSPEAIRRILKGKWRPPPEKMEERRERWARRYDRIWDQKAALGLRPPRQMDREPEGPESFEEEVRAKQMLGHL